MCLVNKDYKQHRFQIEIEMDTFFSTPAIAIGFDNNVKPVEWIFQIAFICWILTIRIR